MSGRISASVLLWLLFLAISFITINCSGNLSRSRAAGLISEFPKFSEVLTGDVRLGEVYVMGVLGDDHADL